MLGKQRRVGMVEVDVWGRLSGGMLVQATKTGARSGRRREGPRAKGNLGASPI